MEHEFILPSAFKVAKGMQIAQYEIGDKLGAGGMGVVYQARDIRLKRLVAIKFMLSPGSHQERFIREMTLLGQLHHSHIIQVYGSGSWNEFPYFVMEYVQGLPLLDYVARCQPKLADKLRIMAQVATAVAYAHTQKVIHRDIKPANILIRSNGEPVLLDFGLAKITQLEERSLTRTGEILGTPEYMAPEQAGGLKKHIDAQTDVYGLGASLYHLLTGVPPVTGNNLIEKVCCVMEKKPVPPRQMSPEVTAAVEQVCLKALEKNKRCRYGSADAFARDLQLVIKGRSPAAIRFYLYRKIWQTSRMVLAAAIVAAMAVMAGRWLLAKPATVISLTTTTVAQENLWYEEIAKLYQNGMARLESSPQEATVYLVKVEKRLQEAASHHADDHRLQERPMQTIRRCLPFHLLQAAFYAQDYATVTKRGTEIDTAALSPQQTLLLLWYLAYAAYCRNQSDDAEHYFSAITNRLTNRLAVADQSLSDPEKYLAGALYYQGVICFDKQQLDQSHAFFIRAVAAGGNKSFDFSAALYLYLCQIILLDLDRELSLQQMQTLTDYWNKLEALKSTIRTDNLAQQKLYWEIRARYWLRIATQAELKKEKRSAQEQAHVVVEAIERCLKIGPPQGVWYYIRSKAYTLLEQYDESERDVDAASLLDPGLIGLLVAKIGSLFTASQPSRLEDGLIALTTYFDGSQRTRQDFWAKEFAALKKRYYTESYGIPYRDAAFAEYYAQLDSPAAEVREAVRAALCSLVPYHQSRQALENKSRQQPTASKMLAEIIAEIGRREQEQERQNFLMALAQVPAQGKIFNLDWFYPQYVPLLKETLQSHNDLLLRFLAARVLVAIPAFAIRTYLSDTYLLRNMVIPKEIIAETPEMQFVINKILVCRAFSSLGSAMVLWELPTVASLLEKATDRLFSRNETEDEFVRMALAQLLPKHNKITLSLQSRLLTSGSTRIKLAVAGGFPLPQNIEKEDPQLFAQLMGCLQDGLNSSDAQIQTWSLNILSNYLAANYLESVGQWREVVQHHLLPQEWHRHFMQTIVQLPPQTQWALLKFWREAVRILYERNQQDNLRQVRAAVMRLWKNSDPVIRYQALTTSSGLWDREVFSKILLAKDTPAVERLSVLIGLLHRGKIVYAREEMAWLVIQFLKQNVIDDPDWHVRAVVLYFLSREASKYAMFNTKQLDALRSEHDTIRYIVAMGMGYWSELSKDAAQKLKKLVAQDPSTDVRAVSLAVLLHHAAKKNTPEWPQLHRQVKELGKANPNFLFMAVWGYSLPWESIFLPYRQDVAQLSLDRQQLWEWCCFRFLQSMQPANVQAFTERLLQINDLLAALPNYPGQQDNLYLLASLYVHTQQYDLAIALIEKSLTQREMQDSALIPLWGKLRLEQGRIQEVRVRLEKTIDGLTPDDNSNLETMRKQNLYRSKLIRLLVEAYGLEQQPREKTDNMVVDQFLLAPHDPMAWLAMGEYWYRQKDYDMAVIFSTELLVLWPRIGQISVLLASVYHAKNQPDQVAFYIRHAYDHGYKFSERDWQRYPQLRPWLDISESQAGKK